VLPPRKTKARKEGNSDVSYRFNSRKEKKKKRKRGGGGANALIPCPFLTEKGPGKRRAMFVKSGFPSRQLCFSLFHRPIGEGEKKKEKKGEGGGRGKKKGQTSVATCAFVTRKKKGKGGEDVPNRFRLLANWGGGGRRGGFCGQITSHRDLLISAYFLAVGGVAGEPPALHVWGGKKKGKMRKGREKRAP